MGIFGACCLPGTGMFNMPQPGWLQRTLLAGYRSVRVASMTTVAIALKEEHQKFIEEAVKSGRYLSESEVVAEALSELKIRDAIRRSKIDDIRAKVLIGIEQADRGEFDEFSAEDIKAQGRERLAKQQGAA